MFDLLALGYPVGRVQVVEVDTASVSGLMVSKSAVAPDWARSFSASFQGSDIDVGTGVEIRAAPGDVVADPALDGRTGPLHGLDLYYPFATPLSIAKSEANGGAVRFKPCSPGMKLRAEVTAVAAGKDARAVVVFEFSPFAPVA